MRLVNGLTESLIVKIWQYQLLDRTDLTTEEGEPIRIIYPGRINDDRGADFLDAVIITSRGLIKGDIEVHVKSSDWRAHRHHQDPTYNRVILHVVMWRATELTTELQNGEKVSILALHKYTKNPTSQWTNLLYSPSTLNMPCHCATGRLTTSIIAEFLDSFGRKRFLAKVARFQADLAQMEAGQSLYQGIMGALGYSKNKLPFLELARRVPLQALESLAQGKISDEECLVRQQALLLGTGGLLPSQRPNWHQKNKIDDEWIERLEELWVSSRQMEVMSVNNWRLFKVRPNNLPIRRIVAMSYLILQYREKGIFEEVIKKIREVPVSKGHHELEKMLLIITNGYWASRLDFGFGSRLIIPTLLGGRRASDIVVNVLLPFAFAWGKFNSQRELAKKALDLYCGYPRLTVNAVERHMRSQLRLSGNFINSAQRQQGLIHIYNTLCSQGKCHRCPLGDLSIADRYR